MYKEKKFLREKISFILVNFFHIGSNGSFLLTGLTPFLVQMVQMVHFTIQKKRKIFKIK